MPLVFMTLFIALNDVSTDLIQPPQFVDILGLPEHQGKDLAYDPAFAEKQKKLHPEVKPLGFRADASELFFKVIQIAQTEPSWQIISVNEKDLRLEAVATTRLIGFKDDIVIEIRISEEDPQQCQVHMRSRSRVGKGDLGANARRIKAFMSSLQSAHAK